MNNLNNLNLKETIISTIQELKAQNPNFFTEPFHILTWKSKKIEGALVTKVNGQRYLGSQRKDIKGQDYWKYKPLTGNSESEQSDPENPTNQPSSSDNITKYQQENLEKTQAINNANNSTQVKNNQTTTTDLTKIRDFQELTSNLQAIQPPNNRTAQLITYALVATAITGIMVYHYIRQQENLE